MLTETEWTLVTELARDHLFDAVEPRDDLRTIFGPEFVGRLRLKGIPADDAFILIAAIREGGLSGSDPSVLRFLDALARRPAVEVRMVGKRVEAMRDKVRHAFEDERRQRESQGDPFLATVWRGEEVFLDRDDLRKALRKLESDEGEDERKLLLQVAGEPESGKSYTWRLIRELQEPREFRAVPVMLDQTGTPEEVIETLALAVASKRDKPPPREGDAVKWYGRASRWLVAKAKDRGGRWWFVLDGLNHLPPTAEVRDLVGKLALAIDLYGDRRLRLVLIGHDALLEWDLRHAVLREDVTPVEEEDLRVFFTEWFDPRGQVDPRELQAKVDDTVSQVLQFATAAGAEGTCFMKAVGQAVEAVVREFSPAREDPAAVDVPLGTFARTD